MTRRTARALAVGATLLLTVVIGAGLIALRSSRHPSSAAPVVAVGTPGRNTATKAPVVRSQPRVAETPSTTAEEPPTEPIAKPEEPVERLEGIRFPWHWCETPLANVLGELSGRSGVSVVLSDEVADRLRADADWGKLEMLSIGREITARQALDLVTQLKSLAWTIDGGRIVIVPLGGTRDASKPVVELPTWSPPPTMTVVGRVTDSSGSAVPDAEIRTISGRVLATTDIAGRYSIEVSRPCPALQARAKGHLPSLALNVDGPAGALTTLDLTLSGRGVPMTIRVVSADGAKGLAGALVTIGPATDATVTLPDGSRGVRAATIANTDDRGVASFPGIAPGVARVLVQLGGFEDATLVVNAQPGDSVESEVQLAPRASLQVRIESARASVDVRDARPREVARALSEAYGVRIVLDSAALSRTSSRSVTFTATSRLLREALELFCSQVGGVRPDPSEKDDTIWIRDDAR